MDLWKRMKQNKNITTHDQCFLKNIELSSTHVATQHRQTTLPSPGLFFFATCSCVFPFPINKSSGHRFEKMIALEDCEFQMSWSIMTIQKVCFYAQPLWFWNQITNGTTLKFHLLKIVNTSLKKYRNTISHNNGPTRPAKCTGMKACQDQELERVL